MSAIRLRPWTVKRAVPFVRRVHRRLPKIQGAMWAVSARIDEAIVGAALIGNPARAWQEDNAVLAVLRVAVMPDPERDDGGGYRDACSMLYGACSRMAKASGAEDLVTYTEEDEAGVTLKAAGWVDGGLTDGGEWDRPSRQRTLALNNKPKRRWLAPWGKRAKAVVAARSAA